MDYSNDEYNDYELLSYICENNEEANDIIYRKYEPLIVSTAKKYHVFCKDVGFELNDLIQEGWLALNKAINHFDEQKNVMFYSFAKLCIERNILSFVIKAENSKIKPLNNSIPLDILAERGYEFKEIGSASLTPEQLVESSENAAYICEQINNKLTSLEQKVFKLKLYGYSYDEISEILKRSRKSIDGALHRIRRKTRKTFEETSIKNR